MYMDQIGHFPVQSSHGKRYVMCMFELDGNIIDAEPMKNKTEADLIRAYLALWS